MSWLIQVQILLRFIWQCMAVILLRRYRPDIPQPFTMWLYPLPALLSLALWLYIFVTGPWEGIVFLVRVPGRDGHRVLAVSADHNSQPRVKCRAAPHDHRRV